MNLGCLSIFFLKKLFDPKIKEGRMIVIYAWSGLKDKKEKIKL